MGEFEVYANRDSLKYIDIYDIKEAKTVLRGTLRNVGWCQTWDKISELGFLDLKERNDLKGLSYKQALAKLIGTEGKNIKEEVAQYLNIPIEHDVIKKMEWLGLFSDDPLPEKGENFSLLDVLSDILEDRLQYKKGERDMLVLVHNFLVEYPQGKKEIIKSTMIDYGIPHGDSSMSRTVSLPAAIAVRLILEGSIKRTGVWIPVTPDFYEPILEELIQLGIKFKEEHVPIKPILT